MLGEPENLGEIIHVQKSPKKSQNNKKNSINFEDSSRTPVVAQESVIIQEPTIYFNTYS